MKKLSIFERLKMKTTIKTMVSKVLLINYIKIIKFIIGIKNKSQGPDPSLALKSPTMKTEILMKACETYKWKYILYL